MGFCLLYPESLLIDDILTFQIRLVWLLGTLFIMEPS